MKIIVLLFLLISNLNCISQNKNYLIKHSGDTIWGDIKLKHKTFFVAGANNGEVNANEVKKISSGKYKGTIVVNCKLQQYTDNLIELEKNWINLRSIDTVLVLEEVYNTAKMNLYFVTDNLKTQYYFYKTPSDTVPMQLVVRYYLSGGINPSNTNFTMNGGVARTHVEEDKGYVNQLRAIMGGCNKIPETMWEILSYRVYSLKQLIKKYNKCK
jgi:hypothetical protein